MTHNPAYRRILTRMGYYAYQNGLIYNHLNQAGGWDEHLSRCRDFVKASIEKFRPETVTVLGSGWLLDVPLAEMSDKLNRIYLVDIIHPPEVIRQAGTMGNVVLVEADITGGVIEEVWNISRRHTVLNRLRSLGTVRIGEFTPDFEPGTVVSLNILTQLESQPLHWLRGRSRIPGEELTAFRRKIQEKHIDFLKRHNSVLITDFSEVVIGRSGQETSVRTLLADLPPGKLESEWTWNLDITGRENYNSLIAMKMIGLAW